LMAVRKYETEGQVPVSLMKRELLQQ